MRQKRKLLKVFIICSFLILCLSGCGKKVDVKVQDGYMQTDISVPAGATVQEVLALAEISVKQKDEVTPSLDTEIGESGADINILRYAKVKAVIGKRTDEIEMIGEKVKDLLKKAGITIDGNDLLSHKEEAFLKDGMSVEVIKRVKAEVVINGVPKEYLTDAGTVGELLDSKGIKMGKQDKVSPKLETGLKEGIKIMIKRTEYKDVVKEEDIPFTTQVTYSDSMKSGTSKVTKAGKRGKKKVTYREEYVDGKKQSSKVVKEEVIQKAEPQILTKGTKKEGKGIVSREKVYDCDGSGHGYYIITYADGKVKYEDF